MSKFHIWNATKKQKLGLFFGRVTKPVMIVQLPRQYGLGTRRTSRNFRFDTTTEAAQNIRHRQRDQIRLCQLKIFITFDTTTRITRRNKRITNRIATITMNADHRSRHISTSHNKPAQPKQANANDNSSQTECCGS